MNQGSSGRGRQGIVSRGSTMPSRFGAGPFGLLHQLDDDLNRLFEELGGGRMSSGRAGQAGFWAPEIEMCERDGKLHVFADLPGMDKDDIKVELDEGRLTIQGERSSSNEDKSQSGRYHSERSYGSFYRSIALPDGVKPDSAQASFRDGVLDVCFDAPDGSTRQRRRLQIDEGALTTARNAGSTAASASNDVAAGSAAAATRDTEVTKAPG